MKCVLVLLLLTVLVQCEYYQRVKRYLQNLTDEELEALFKEALKENSEKSDNQKNLNQHPKVTIQREHYSVRDNENKKEEIYNELKNSNYINNFKLRDIENTEKNEMIKNEKKNFKKSVNINILIGKEGANKGSSNWHSNWPPKGVVVKTLTSKQHPDSGYPDGGSPNGAYPQHPEGITGSSYSNTGSGVHSGKSNPIIAPPPLTRDEERYFNNDEFSNVPQGEEKFEKSNYNNLVNKKSNGIHSKEINQIKSFKKDNFDVENLDNEEKLDIFEKLLDRSYGNNVFDGNDMHNDDEAKYSKNSYDYIKKELQNLNGNVIRTLLTKEIDNKQQEDNKSKKLTQPIRPIDKETLNTLMYHRMKATHVGNTKNMENINDESHIDKIEKPDNTNHGKGGKNILQHGKEAVKSGFKNLKGGMKSFTHKFMESIFHRKKEAEDNMKGKNVGNTKNMENIKDESHIDKIEKPDNTVHGKDGKNILQHGKEAVKSGFKNLKGGVKSFTHKFMENIFHRKKKSRKEDFEENFDKFERKIDSATIPIREGREAEEYYTGVKRHLRELSNKELVALFKKALKENIEMSN